jgi:hypothetical protein
MDIDLIGRGESFNWDSWRACLAVAVAFDWEPAGTAMPDDNEWKGTYFSNDLQIVTDEDARALSLALYRALAALSTGQVRTEKQTKALRDSDASELRRLADVCATRGFLIG